MYIYIYTIRYIAVKVKSFEKMENNFFLMSEIKLKRRKGRIILLSGGGWEGNTDILIRKNHFSFICFSKKRKGGRGERSNTHLHTQITIICYGKRIMYEQSQYIYIYNVFPTQ